MLSQFVDVAKIARQIAKKMILGEGMAVVGAKGAGKDRTEFQIAFQISFYNVSVGIASVRSEKLFAENNLALILLFNEKYFEVSS